MLALLATLQEEDALANEFQFILCEKKIKLKQKTITMYCLTELPAYTKITRKILLYEDKDTEEGFQYSNSLVLQNPVLQGVDLNIRV